MAVGGHVVYIIGMPLHTCSRAILFSVASIIYYFQDPNLHSFIERCLRNHCIKFGGELTPEPKTVIFYIPNCQTEVCGCIVYVMGIPLNICSGSILFRSEVLFIILGSKPPYPHREVSFE